MNFISKLLSEIAPCLYLLIVLLLSLTVWVQPLYAQIASTQVDIGNTGATGTFNYSSGTYTIAGAGSGIGGTGDSFSYVYTQANGNVEIIAKVTSQTNTSSYAVAGLMIRETLNADARQAVVGVSPANGVNFTYRSTAGAASNTVLGPSIAAPVWLRLVRSGNTFAGYQSADGINWKQVGSYQINMANSFYIGFAVSSNSYGNLSTVTYTNANLMSNVPQRSANLKAWLRSDVGVVNTAGNVTQWQDQSGNGHHANQTVGGSRPTLTTGAINGLPAISFNGTSQFLQLGPGFADFTAGASFFVVYKPTAVPIFSTRILDFGTNVGATNSVIISELSNTSNGFYVVNDTTVVGIDSTAGLTLNQYQLLECIQNGAGSGTMWTNGIQNGQGSLPNIANVPRSSNCVGKYNSGNSNYYQGEIAEILVYNGALTSSQRKSIEGYVYQKYGIGSMPTLDAPVISPGSGIYTTGQSITIASTPGTNIYYTTDGSTPTTGSTLYTGPFSVGSTVTVKAIATGSGYQTSPVATANIQIDMTTLGVPKGGLLVWLRSDTGLITSGNNVITWTDVSGNKNDASQSNSINRPTVIDGALNNFPTVSFIPGANGQFLQFNANFNDFTDGISMFVVCETSNVLIAGARIVDMDAPAGGQNISLYGYDSTSIVFFSGSTVQYVLSPNGLTLGQYQLQEAIQNGSNSASIWTNGVFGAQATMQNLPNTARTVNSIGRYGLGGYYFNGKISEILIYKKGLTAAQRSNVEAYLMQRYQLLNVGSTPAAPVFSVTSGTTFPSPSQVAIAGLTNATVYYTTDGSTPTTSSFVYTGPINVSYSQTLKAIAVLNGVSSSVSTASYTLNPTNWPAPDPGDPTPLQINVELPPNAAP